MSIPSDMALPGIPVDRGARVRVAWTVKHSKGELHRINLFVAPADGVVGAGITSTARNGYNILEWQAGGLSYRAVSDIDAAELAQFAELVRVHNKPS
jgi:anti-sigma factor RsiW